MLGDCGGLLVRHAARRRQRDVHGGHRHEAITASRARRRANYQDLRQEGTRPSRRTLAVRHVIKHVLLVAVQRPVKMEPGLNF